MAINTTAVANTIQPFFSKKLLDHAVQVTTLADYAVQEELPPNSGANQITFFRPPQADLTATGAPAALTEGTTPAARRDIAYTPVTATLAQRGQVAELTDVATTIGLFDFLKTAVALMGEECALDADSLMRNQLCHASTGLTKRYAQGLANFAALAAATAALGSIKPLDVLDGVTALKIARAPKINGWYVLQLPPQLSRDIQNNADWRDVVKMNANTAQQVFKGEIGEYCGAKFVENTNPMQEDETEGTHVPGAFNVAGTNTTGFIYSAILIGKGSYGCVNLKKLGASKIYKPQVIINDQPDKYDPLNQKIVVGWKSYWASLVLNSNWGRVIRAKSQFA